MNEAYVQFLKENYFIPIYFIGLVISLIRYRTYFDTPLRYFPLIIAYTLVNELLGVMVKTYPDFSFFDDIKYSEHNDIIYNLYSIIFFGFFFIVYMRIVRNTKYKKWIKYIALFVLATYILSCFFQNPINTNLFYAHAIGSWGLLAGITLYFLDKKTTNTFFYQPLNLVFWISMGLIIFYSVFPFLFLIGYLNYELWEHYHFRTVLRVLIVLMYSSFIIGLIKGRRSAFG